MSGNDNKKDSFENFFKKKSQEYNIPYREEDWLKLERKLDLRAAQISYRKKVIWIAAASILVVSLLGYFTMDNHNRINEITQQLSEDAIPEARPIPDIEDFLTDREDQSPLPDESEDILAEGDGIGPGPLNIPDSLRDELSRHPTAEVPDDRAEYGMTEPHREGSVAIRSFMDLSPQLPGLSCASCILGQQEPSEYDAMEMLVRRQPGVLDPVDEQNINPRGENDMVYREYESDWKTSSRLSVGLALSPDLSTVGSVSNFYDPGYKAGFTLEYKVSSDLSIAAGVIQSMVRYQARSGDYNPPVYWADGIVPSEIIGECLLIDIPISLKFDFMHFSHSRFFATAGLSSYIMQNEEYYFSYDSYGSGLMEGWSGETGTRHWMSNAGFSIGYELDLHSNWSLRAEPFIKVPLQEVGWGNVKLYSMGSFVSINYRL